MDTLKYLLLTSTGWDPSTNSSSWENLILPSGSYYAALELYSGGNTYDIRILDDNTVPQPAWSSAIWFSWRSAYTNGNAFAIRMNLGANVNIEENNLTKLNYILIQPKIQSMYILLTIIMLVIMF